MNEISIAWALAQKFHAGQFYGSDPYTRHLGDVMSAVQEAFPNDERLEVVAVLHDILEDTACPESVLRALFEDNIVDAVVAFTRKPGESKESYAARVKANPMAVKVKKMDSFCNLRESLMRGDMRRVIKYSEFLGVMASW